ncbi:MAG TPA: Lrp/AsnC family transcriptional regulator [Thermoplasmata archaeon]|nr:Lrp/AsnC family transcriptional regulator [Thermoplasmata archaeon]
MLDNLRDLRLIENLCSGRGVAVNISQLSKSLNRHRNTIKDRVEKLLKYKIINRPVYSYLYLAQEFPLIAIVRADLPRDKKTEEFILYDEHIFAAFFVREGEYNTLLVEFHKGIDSFTKWRENLIREGTILPKGVRYPSDTLFFSTKLVIKNEPYAPTHFLEEELKREGLEMNGYAFDDLSFQILKKLMSGEGIRTNEQLLAGAVGMQRKTVERHISNLLDKKIVGKPVCNFPRFFAPPNYVITLSLCEVKRNEDRLIKAMTADSHIPIIIKTSVGRYNLLTIGAFSKIEEYIKWEEEQDQRFPDSIGATKTTYLSPEMTFSIDPQYVSLCSIKKKIEELHGKELIKGIYEKESCS